MPADRVLVFEQDEGDWWAECLVCGAWVTTRCPDRRSAVQKFGRHWQNDHSDPETSVLTELVGRLDRAPQELGRFDLSALLDQSRTRALLSSLPVYGYDFAPWFDVYVRSLDELARRGHLSLDRRDQMEASLRAERVIRVGPDTDEVPEHLGYLRDWFGTRYAARQDELATPLEWRGLPIDQIRALREA